MPADRAKEIYHVGTVPKVFVSYRRGDSRGETGRLADHLAQRFGGELIFRDIEDLGIGVDFPAELKKALGESAAMLVMIGPRWISEYGSRLNEPGDFVRMEVAAGLSRPDVQVIPVLVGGARMPSAQELPDVLKPLCDRNATEISESRWNYDVNRLCDALEARLDKLPDGHIPFALTAAQADAAVQAWLAATVLAAAAVRSGVTAKIEQAYVPFWIMSGGASATYKGEVGEEQKQVQQMAAAAAAGSAAPATAEATMTVWRPASGAVMLPFSNRALCASNQAPPHTPTEFPDEVLAKINRAAPDDNVRIYDATRDKDGAEEVLRAELEMKLRDLADSRMKAGRMVQTRDISLEPTVQIKDRKLVLVPLYYGAYSHDSKSYAFAINGATGEVAGDYPLDKKKVGVMAAVVVGLLALLVAWLMGWLGR